MSSPSTPKSFRSRMGGVMRRTSSVLTIANSRPTTPTPGATPAPGEDLRRSSVSKSVEARKSTSSLTPSNKTAPQATPLAEPVSQQAPIAVELTPERESAAAAPKSFRSRMGGVMRRTSSVLATANSRSSTPTPGPVEDSRRSSVSKSVEGRKSTSSLTPSNKTPPEAVPPPEPVPQQPPVAVEPTPEPVPAEVAPVEEAAPLTIDVEAAPTPPPTAAPRANDPKAVKRLLPVAVQYQMYPSPIAESPAREAAAEEAEKENAVAPGPSRLSAVLDVEEEEVAPAVEAPPPPPAAEEESVPPVVEPAHVVEEAPYVPPPPMLDSGNSTVAFTDEPLDMEMSPPVSDEPPVAPEPVVLPAPEPASAPIPALDESTYLELVPAAAPAHDVAPEPASALIPALDEFTCFDPVPAAAPVHDVAAASPATGSETVVGADEHHHEHEHAHVQPYPYELRPATPMLAAPVVVDANATATPEAIAIPSVPESEPGPEEPRTFEPAADVARPVKPSAWPDLKAWAWAWLEWACARDSSGQSPRLPSGLDLAWLGPRSETVV